MAEQTKTTYGAVYCKECGKTHYYKSLSGEKPAELETMKCPECDKELADKRAACGHRFLGSREGDRGEWTCDLDDKTIEDIEELLGAVGRPGL